MSYIVPISEIGEHDMMLNSIAPIHVPAADTMAPSLSASSTTTVPAVPNVSNASNLTAPTATSRARTRINVASASITTAALPRPVSLPEFIPSSFMKRTSTWVNLPSSCVAHFLNVCTPILKEIHDKHSRELFNDRNNAIRRLLLIPRTYLIKTRGGRVGARQLKHRLTNLPAHTLTTSTSNTTSNVEHIQLSDGTAAVADTSFDIEHAQTVHTVSSIDGSHPNMSQHEDNDLTDHVHEDDINRKVRRATLLTRNGYLSKATAALRNRTFEYYIKTSTTKRYWFIK